MLLVDVEAVQMMMKWAVRVKLCPECGGGMFTIFDYEGRVWGCQETHADAINYAQHKAREMRPRC